ncbi:hypothetical protein PIB30_051128 [Stylosanthes scabra]|uniref:RNA polymerase II subunit 5-mediating protein homolog n=1 Tax=Stylosanthes scabra TaxID=79078 RepID=A0ABU6XJ74_9FABA|nr:hypothetical protein [Stylosanthes scabra]
MEDTRRGTVTSLASLFPVEEAQKAANRVQDAIAEKRAELDHLLRFVADNNNLINLVHKLPEELSHEIMVPFGKAAFFPGRLIHTNEFLVLLGEGYYAERTSKQTAEILGRRGKALDSQVDSLEAMIKDLQAEANFFSQTITEAAEGLVEIREDYIEKDSHKEEIKSGPLKQHTSDLEKTEADNEEYARIVARMDELEKEELAAESGIDNEKDEQTTEDVGDISYQRPVGSKPHNSEDFHKSTPPVDQANNKSIATGSAEKHDNPDIADQLNFASLDLQSNVGEGKNAAAKKVKFVDHRKPLTHHEEKTVKATTASKSEVQHQPSQPSFNSHKAFTGSIVEHTENLKTLNGQSSSSTSSQVSGSRPSKPVSRFKMQRR